MFPRYLWIIVIIDLIFFAFTLYGILTYGYGIFINYFGLSFCLTLLLILIYLIWWNYFSRYPAFVQISQECISILFREIFRPNRTIEITSQNHPAVLASSGWINEIGFSTYYSRVLIESTTNHSIIIYHQFQSSEKQAVDTAANLAKKIATKTGFLLKYIGCGLTRRSS